MSYEVKLTVHASEVAKRLPPEIKKAAKGALRKLEENPDLGKELQAELAGFRSYRFMRYRIVYKVAPEKKIVVVWAVGHRRDIYENFSEKLIGKR
jgi:mRNA-degrading endonuclease RelE of RelBE toxin-antitoxin system